MSTVRIDLEERGYDIKIGEGLLEKSDSLIAKACKGKKAAIITNPTIGNLYADIIANRLEASGISTSMITIPAGEKFKTLKTMAQIYEGLLDARIDRSGIVIGLGGGVVGDLAGFAAATFLRGIDFIQIPTSLLAQVDSSVGGKTGANLSRGKNLVGSFYQPKLVIIDLKALDTLPKKEFKAGMAEVIKHGIIRDSKYFDFIDKNIKKIMKLEPAALEHTIQRSCEIKADVVRRDERESGLRRILNFGHTIGHAVERLTNYRQYKHGEAVSIGMVAAALASQETGAADPSTAQKIIELLKKAGLPYKLPQHLDHKDIIAATGFDKKVSQGKLNAVMVRCIGEAYVTDDVPKEAWQKALETQSRLQ